jgi:hypothetical protein
LLGQCQWLRRARAPGAQHGVITGREPEDDGHDHQAGRPDLGDGRPAEGDHDQGRQQLGYRSADIAHAEDAKRGALPLPRVPARYIGDAHGEGAARDADAERGEKHHRIGGGIGQQEGRHRGRQHHQREDDPAAQAVGPDAQRQADQGAAEDGCADEKPELRIVEAKLLLYADADDRKDRPDGKAHRESDGADPKDLTGPHLPGGRIRCLLHLRVPSVRPIVAR